MEYISFKHQVKLNSLSVSMVNNDVLKSHITGRGCVGALPSCKGFLFALKSFCTKRQAAKMLEDYSESKY